MHSVETCVPTNILAHNLLKTLLQIALKKLHAKFVVLIGMYLVNTHKKIGLEKFLEIDQH